MNHEQRSGLFRLLFQSRWVSVHDQGEWNILHPSTLFLQRKLILATVAGPCATRPLQNEKRPKGRRGYKSPLSYFLPTESSTQNPSEPLNSNKKVAGLKALAEEEVSRMKEEIKLARDAEVHGPATIMQRRARKGTIYTHTHRRCKA